MKAARSKRRRGCVGKLVGKVGTCPVQYGHEVVRHDVHTAFAEVAQAFLVVVDIPLEISGLRLDVLVYGYAFNDRPAETCGFNHLLAFHDFFHRPHLTVGDVVQGVHDAGSMRASLLGTIEPITATITTVLMLGTTFSPADLVGFAMILEQICHAIVLTVTGDVIRDNIWLYAIYGGLQQHFLRSAAGGSP